MPRIRSSSRTKFIDLIEETSREIKRKYKKIGILSTTKTRKEKLYDNLLENVEIIYPNEIEQREVSDIIIRIIRGKETTNDKNYLERIIGNFIKQGAEKVLLACTDLANLIKNNKDTLDTTEILIKSVIREMNK
tara:strand:+ start:3924 stop:4325 length:402 start_codon:yes stop_codon:yes gene_type:complete